MLYERSFQYVQGRLVQDRGFTHEGLNCPQQPTDTQNGEIWFRERASLRGRYGNF